MKLPRTVPALVLAVLGACGRNTGPSPQLGSSSPDEQPGALAASATATSTPSEPAATAAPDARMATARPLTAESELVNLAVPGFRDAVVSVPLGAMTKKPVVLALHGNFDRPEWQCEVWRSIVQDSAFVLCPRGVPRAGAPRSLDRWEYGSGKKTREELDAALSALGARFPEHVAEGPLVFTGFSLGAILGVRLVQGEASRYPRVVLTEGGQNGWTTATAKAFKAAGGQRVLFACGQGGCVQNSRSLAKMLEKHGILARVADGGKAGHTYDGPVARAIAEHWAWLVEGDARFGPTDAPVRP
jgi:hypothetical protein